MMTLINRSHRVALSRVSLVRVDSGLGDNHSTINQCRENVILMRHAAMLVGHQGLGWRAVLDARRGLKKDR